MIASSSSSSSSSSSRTADGGEKKELSWKMRGKEAGATRRIERMGEWRNGRKSFAIYDSLQDNVVAVACW